MNVCVLSGSPKGKYSVTLQTALFLEKKFTSCSFEIIHVGAQIKSLEKNFAPALEKIMNADILLFCYPVYTFTVPCQLHRFIELLKESGADLSGKCAAQISTSMHFYDTTANNFIKENCADMSLRYLGCLPSGMEDLLTEKGQNEAISFWKTILWRYENGICEPAAVYNKTAVAPYTASIENTPKDGGKPAVIVTSLDDGDTDLKAMIEDFKSAYPHETKTVNLMEFPFKGGCLGCLNCAVSGKCVYKDGFDDFLRNEIQTASAIIYAFRIKDHSMGSRMKMYDDRQFCNGHRTVTSGMPVGYIVYGDLINEPNLRMIIEGRADVGGNYLAGVATDKKGIIDLAKTLDFALQNNIALPQSFLGVGGMKIFRDLIWKMQGMMKADHAYYKEHGLYDFPQKEKGTVLKMKLVGALVSNQTIKKKMGANMMNEGMLMPYRKLFEKITPEAEKKNEKQTVKS